MLSMLRRNSFSKCLLYVFEFTFNLLSFTKKDFVASFHDTQPETMTFLDIYLFGEKSDYHVHHTLCRLHKHGYSVEC